MKKLIDEEWATEVSTEASHNLNINRFNKPTLMLLAEYIAVCKYLYLIENTNFRISRK